MGRSSEWLPINPGTDAALCSAIACELIKNDMVDKEFLDKYCIGYDEGTMPESAKGQNKSYKDYIMGTGYDHVEKTPSGPLPSPASPPTRSRSSLTRSAPPSPCSSFRDGVRSVATTAS